MQILKQFFLNIETSNVFYLLLYLNPLLVARFTHRPDDGSSLNFRNVFRFLPDYAAQHDRMQSYYNRVVVKYI